VDPPVSEPARPLLVYDGDCGFCVYWARYWERLTGDSVQYRPYQEITAQHPEISLAEFQRAVQYIGTDERRASAAEASFLTLSHAPGRGFWLSLYRRLPGFASVSELTYAFIATHRSAFYRISLILWGKDYQPPQYDLVRTVFLRLLGLIYLSAFVSFGVQARGLISSHGILPLEEFIDAVSEILGAKRFFVMPMLFWINASDVAIQVVCWLGTALSVLLFLNRWPRLCLLLLYVLYLSLLYAGQDFMTFQWDTFLLETGFLALLMSFAERPGIWLLRWLLFRFTFMSGMVKLLSGDPNWRNLTALSYHFFTQPLPTPLAWYAARLPASTLQVGTGALFFIELVLPFLIFCPRRLRFVAAFGTLLLQTLIFLTGNYNWFNLQCMLLCLLLFDDAAVRRLLPQSLTRAAPLAPRVHRPATKILAAAVTLLIVFCSLVQMVARFGGDPPVLARAVEGLVEPFHVVNSYGLFAVMTTQRDEIVIEGSNDGVEWREYEFRYKPGDLSRRPPWNIPHQPRLDWQMWFAALDDPRRLGWFHRFLRKVLQNEPSVIALMERNPFPDGPPTYVRAEFYDYTYSSPAEKSQGIWWDRRLLGLYFPVARLKAE
jgi:predicted DCC family thiol-disulfide oxidoreductase YuxK